VRAKVLRLKASPLLWLVESTTAEGMEQNAAMNLATVEMLPEILDDALAEQDQATALGQAMVIVQLTGESTVRYGEWAESWSIVTFAKNVWVALVDLVADLAYEVADAVLIVGRRAGDALGIGGVFAAVAGLGLVAFIVTR